MEETIQQSTLQGWQNSQSPLKIYGVTRLFAIGAGALCVVYVNWTLDLSGHIRWVFAQSAAVTILTAVVMTMQLARLLTRDLRRYLHLRADGLPTPDDLQSSAARQAVLFPQRLAFWEAMIDPWITIAPICVALWYANLPANILLQVCVAGFVGLSCIILTTYFYVEDRMKPVVLDLLSSGVSIDFAQLPQSRLGRRLEVGFGTTILVTAVMIAGLGMARSLEILKHPENAAQTVQLLRQQTLGITICALLVGLAYAGYVARSVTTRVATLVEAMQRLEQGDFQQEICPTGTDEIDRLARQFNGMVRQLARSDRELRDLNTDLERVVDVRTHQLQESISRLEEVNQLKTNFFANVSHELRTPLLMILSPLMQLKTIVADRLSLEDQGLVRVAEVNSRRLLTLINHLLEFSRIEAGKVRLKPERLDVHQQLGWLVEAARPLAVQRELELIFEPGCAHPSIVADREKLEIIVTNLLSNAIKFTPAGGQIVVRTANCDSPQGGIEISVKDTGAGITPEECDQLFQRFSQLDRPTCREFSGTGLGLALVKELTELHAGSAGVHSAPGAGATFFVQLPRGDELLVGSATDLDPVRGDVICTPFAELERVDFVAGEPTASEEPEEERPTILVVDDNVEVRQLLRRLLQSKFKVIEAADGVEGCLQTRQHRPDCIISDAMMPRMDGNEFCREMKGDPQTAPIPFMMLTARVGIERMVEGLDCGADDYLSKPFEAVELFARLRALLRISNLNRHLYERNVELETALRQNAAMQEQLIRSEKLTSLGQLVAGLAHEVNNSITPICSGTDVLRDRLRRIGHGLDSDAPETELLRKTVELTNVISQGAQRTANIVQDMRQFAHPGCGDVQKMELSRTLSSCLNLLKLRHSTLRVFSVAESPDEDRAGLLVVTHFDKSIPRSGRFGQLDQVFMNILENAAQELNDSGRIDIFTTETESSWTVRIRDNGGGVPEEIRSRIFDPFFTTKPPGRGTGLGLAISHRIVESCNGSLTVESEVGKFTEFTIQVAHTGCVPERKSAF